MKKILVLMLIVTMMLTAFLALGAAANVNKSTANTTNTTLGLNVTKSITNATSATPISEAAKSNINKTGTAPSPEPTSTTKSTTTTTTSGFYPNFPWYSSNGSRSFYSQGVPDTTFSPFRGYYATSGTPVVGGIISTPIKFDIAQKTPSRIYFGTGQPLPYTQYVSTVPSRTNELWVQGATDWSQYVVSPLGTWLQLVAYAPVGGSAGFYEIVQTDTTAPKYTIYQFYPGYNTMNFNADQVGRHILLYVVNNQPSNVVIVDVFAQAKPA